MSDLYRNAMAARLAKLPADVPHAEDDEEDEASDSLGSLPGSGMGPPAMQVVMCAAVSTMHSYDTLHKACN